MSDVDGTLAIGMCAALVGCGMLVAAMALEVALGAISEYRRRK